MKKPFIFITNDDGVNARGLKAVTEVALRFGARGGDSAGDHAIGYGPRRDDV